MLLLPPPSGTQVHPPETTVPDEDALPLWARILPLVPAQQFRHSGWAADRARIWNALRETSPAESRLRRFATCGSRPHVFQSIEPPYKYKVAGDWCRDRFCVPCSRLRGYAVVANILDKLDGSPCRFLTLTLRSREESLTQLLDQIQRSFRVLRHTDTWRNSVTGGVAFVEAKWNPEPGRWHVHLHAILQGKWVNKPDLEHHWRRITKGSYVCDLQYCPGESKVTQYITKYCTKPYDHSVILVHDRLVEAVAAYSGRRLFTTFGDWRGFPLLRRDRGEAWLDLGSLFDIMTQASSGSDYAENILRSIDPEAAHTAMTDFQARSPPHHALPGEEWLPGKTQLLCPVHKF